MASREIEGLDRGRIELERTSSAGLVMVIVCMDPSRNGENMAQPRFWTNIEKKSKPATGRIAGQTSFPGESTKTNKSIEDTIAGGLVGEFSGDINMIKNIFITPSWFAGNKIQVEGNPFDLAVFAFRGSLSETIKPFDTNEVYPNGWMTREEIQAKDPQRDPKIVRGFVHQVFDLEIAGDYIKRVMLEYEKGDFMPITQMLPRGIENPKQFFEEREKLGDILDFRKN